ncbi:MAG TPA: hypothetical protein VE444_04815, partial [Gaiellaceae bacterium]|nr:hypothetical protein [Gaiellaceae bacterium]
AATVVAAATALPADARPVASLSASPARVSLVGSTRTTVTLRNFGSSPLVVSASTAGLDVDVRGRPSVRASRGGRRSAARWLDVRPLTVVVQPSDVSTVVVTSRLPRRAAPGDHQGAVLFTTRAPKRGAVGIRMRLAVRVAVRAPGRLVSAVSISGVRVRRVRNERILDVRIANRGNVTAALERGHLVVALLTPGRTTVRLVAPPREVLPGADALIGLRYRGTLRGRVLARVSVAGGRVRAFWVRL